ncbi:hypothetical protein F4604DRAFT_1917860 [Suillus subluteus]|nr:hypothetical protein F4604DRAFT_1917860 [Suillus subluteus]
MDVLWKSQGFFCRGTVCYRVRDPTNGKDYAMKDCWVPEAKRYHEVAILERVKGIPNVVQLVDHWDVMYNRKPDWVITGSTSALGRSQYVLFVTVIAHRLMVECGILHGDLSTNNFIIHEGIGYFIDFDHARFIEEGKISTISFGTGTIPYISMCVLKMMSRNAETMKKTADATQLQQIQHYACDDLESMFYIFFKFVTKYGGARGILMPTWDKLTMPWSEAYENLGASSLLTTFLSKKGAISEGNFLMDRVSDYFLEFKPLMLVMFIAKLEDKIPIPIPIPLPCPPSQSPTLQPTAGPSTLPCTDTSWPSTGQPGPRRSQ